MAMDAECALHQLTCCMKDINKWMSSNKLKLNEGKTDFAIIASPHNLKRLGGLELVLDNTIIRAASSVPNLGVIFDNKMSMTQQVTKLCSTINYHLCNIGKIRHYIDEETCHAVVWALVFSRLDYCNALY